MELAPDSPWGHMALGYYHYWGKKEYESALRAFETAQPKMGEDAELYEALANVRRRQGHFRRALEYYILSMNVDPRATDKIFNVAETHGLLLEFESTLHHAARLRSLIPDQRWAYTQSAFWYLQAGDAERARELLDASPSPARSDRQLVLQSRLDLCLRRYDRAERSASAVSVELLDGQFRLFCRPLTLAIIRDLNGDSDGAREAYEDARIMLEKRILQNPDDAKVHSALGQAYAGLGRAEDAVREGELAVEMYPPSIDAYIAPYRVADLVRIHARLGNVDRAFDLIEGLLKEDSWVLTTGWMSLHPQCDPLRDHPRFQRLLREYPGKRRAQM